MFSRRRPISVHQGRAAPRPRRPRGHAHPQRVPAPALVVQRDARGDADMLGDRSTAAAGVCRCHRITALRGRHDGGGIRLSPTFNNCLFGDSATVVPPPHGSPPEIVQRLPGDAVQRGRRAPTVHRPRDRVGPARRPRYRGLGPIGPDGPDGGSPLSLNRALRLAYRCIQQLILSRDAR